MQRILRIVGDNMSKFNDADLKKIEGYWIQLEKLKKDLKFREWELLHQYKEEDKNIGGGKSSNTSDTTFMKANALVEDKVYQNLKNIVETIEKLYPQLDDIQKKIVELRYWDKEGCWEWEDIAAELYISRNKALNKRNALIDKTAERLGWI